MNIQEDLEYIMRKNGAYTEKRIVPQEIMTEFEDKLPEFLLELWRQYGFGMWHNGLFQICNPHDFAGILSQIFQADKDFSHKDCHVIAYSAFGDLVVWSERHWTSEIDLLRGLIDCPKLIYPEKGRDPDIHLSSRLSISTDAINAYDDSDKPLFARARKRLGDLEPGECYGFFPALAMGGAPNLENLKRTDALAHFTFIAQLQPFTLIDYLSRPIKAVRQIG